MQDTSKKYWRGIEELNATPDFVAQTKKEFPEFTGSNQEGHYRRDFLKLMGFSVAAATLAACETPVRKAIPYVSKPEDVDPTIPNYYASTYLDGGDYCSIVVKTREGRPIKIEGNKNSSVTKGGISARVAASVLSLYDKERFTDPLIANNKAKWEELDTLVSAKLGNKIAIVSQSILSPSLQSAINELTTKYAGSVHITYDPVSASGIIEANEKAFGISGLPSFDFSKAKVIVSFGADFLGTWLAPTVFTKQYAATRKLSKSKKEMSRHYQFESIMSLTGANADFRTPIKPSQEGLLIANLYNLLAAKAGSPSISVGEVKDVKYLQKAADDLLASKGRSLVVSGSNDANVQLVIAAINNLLGNYDNTVYAGVTSNFRKGKDAQFKSFIESLNSGAFSSVIFLGCNPVYDSPSSSEFKKALSGVSFKVAINDRPNETTVLCDAVAPDHHYLESWSDANPSKGKFSLGQPAISPLFNTRQAIESLLTWAGNITTAYEYIRAYWKNNLFSLQSEKSDFTSFWDVSLHKGVFELPVSALSNYSFDVTTVANAIASTYKSAAPDVEYVLYEKISLGTGSQANNPWLQELPEPVSKACWDNYACVSPKFASENGWAQGDLIKIDTKNGSSVTLPVLLQPGQAYGTVAMALGYGRTVAGKVANGVGQNVYPLINFLGNQVIYTGTVAQISKTGETREIAQTQTHHTMMARPVVQESTFAEYLKNPAAGREELKIKTTDGQEKKPTDISLWNTQGLKTHQYNNHFWGLAIDLNSCTGCSACVVSCQAENNVPVVGRQEVINRREMHWIRIDRYYSSDALDQEDKSVAGLLDRERENPGENPQVVFQPVMCQHCNNAPCETVCPVLATTHSTEGLNQMTYNRCVGTRYCANNCPYKVRRFNWFSYYYNKKFAEVNPSMFDDLGRMVLNPDVTVRARGVMEKCSMCVQRIQAGKLAAKIEKRRPKDGEIETACSQSCPSEALVFGDMNDPESRISKLMNEENKERNYYLLEELNVKPSVSYLTKIRNV